MPVRREETLKKAEKLLKQNKLAEAIAEYVRLVEERPGDWNSANALGDLYVKAGDIASAREQFTRVADHLCDEGFLPRAAAVYKKVLKISSEDDHAIWRLGDIAGRQGLSVDARAYYGRLILSRRAAGDDRGAMDCLVRLALLNDATVETRLETARALLPFGESTQAAALMIAAAELLTKEGRYHDAVGVLTEAAALDPQNASLRERLAAASAAAASDGRSTGAADAVASTFVAQPGPPGAGTPPASDSAHALPLDALFDELQAMADRRTAQTPSTPGDAGLTLPGPLRGGD